jgi:hypothetical protein
MSSKFISGIINSNLPRGIIVFVEYYWIWQIWPIFTVGQGSLFNNIIKMPCNSLTFQKICSPIFWAPLFETYC